MEDFNKVLDLCEKSFDRETIFEYLKNGSIVEKQLAVLELNDLNSETEAEILMHNLVGIDGKVRQAVAFKILQLMENYSEYFYSENFYPIWVKSIIDIDSNVCRLVIDSVRFLKSDEKFSKYLVNELKNVINIAFDELSKLSFRTKKYTSNKQYFKIYWALETLTYFYENLSKEDLKEILIKCSDLPEYTIREKCAVILKNDFEDDILLSLREKLKLDENYYVRNV